VAWIARARLHKQRAGHLWRSGRPWAAELNRALTAVDHAQSLITSSGQTRQIRAELYLDRAAASTGAAREGAARQAIAAATDAKAHNPNITKELDALCKEAEKLLTTPPKR
jgi:hypothetical protein